MRRRGVGRLAGVALLASFAFVSTAPADDDLDDILGGFEDEDPLFEVDSEREERVERWWDFSGSIEFSGSFNYLHHTSATGTDYFGLQRARGRANGQLDLDLPWDWQIRLEGWGFYDVAYAINGRENYTPEVLSQYELDGEIGEAWIHGPLGDHIDVTLGRQIVVWGRSENLRVLDIVNPVDNREPGRVDLEDIRRPLGMLRVDGYLGDWSVTGMAITEHRFDLVPVVGSDFFPGTVQPPEVGPSGFREMELMGAVRLFLAN